MSEVASYLDESRFYMWRALFAMAHVDGIVTSAEADFLSNCLSRDKFSMMQKEALMQDIIMPQEVKNMFIHIFRESDKIDFFILCDELCTIDESKCDKEQRTLKNLKKEEYLGFPLSELNEKILERKTMHGPSN